MGEKPERTTSSDEKHSINWRALILWPIGIFIFYVLSFGPVSWFWDREPFKEPSPIFREIYSPLTWAYENTPLHKPLGLWLHLWDSAYYDDKGNERTIERA